MARLLQVLAIILTGGLAYLLRVRPLKQLPTRTQNVIFQKHRINQPGHFSLKSFFAHHPEAYLLVGLIFVSIAFSPWLSKYRFLFQASLIDLPSVEFTGTTYPVKQVPIWTDLSDAERLLNYSQLSSRKKMALPAYDLSAMRAGQTWKPDNARERNIYITYPVPNLGNYQLDGTENSGSHPGIDIKIPVGTPIHAIANGIVYKVGNLSTGFGKSVSVAHVGIPDPANPNQKTTLVSTYAHLSSISVKEGDQIIKNQVIGKSGDTGFATTPHLHFQVDRMDAPFIPYWPFSWNEVEAAGLNSMFDAVKKGLGKSNARKYTVHPFSLIASNLDYQAEPLLVAFDDSANDLITDGGYRSSAVELAEKAPEEFTSAAEPEVATFSEPSINTDPSQIEVAPTAQIKSSQTFKRGQLQLEFETDRSYTPGKEETVKIRINEANLVASAGILLSSTLKDRADVYPAKLNAQDFTDGVAEIRVKTNSSFPFKLVAVSDYGEIKSPSLRPEIFADVAGDHTFATAIGFLKDNNIVKGYADNTFRPDNTLNRAESLKIILEANNITAIPEAAPFDDVPNGSWFYNYVTTAFKKSIVRGYEDGSFRPANTVSRAEFLKMAIATAGFEPSMELVQDPYSDVLKSDWHAKYFEFSKGQDLLRIKPGNLMTPNSPITRGEAAEVIYKLSRVQGR